MATAERDVRNWVKALGGLCAGALPQREAEAKATAYAPLLAAEFGAECFTPASLASVARACKFFPSFGEVAAALSAWWQEHRAPDLAKIAGPEPADHYERYDLPKPRTPPTEAELAAVGEMVAAFRMEVAARHVSAAINAAKPARQPRALTDAELLAVWQKAAPNGARTQALEAKLRAAERVPA